MCKPVIISNYPTSSSQLIDSIDGFIVSLNNQEFALQTINIIKNKELVNRVKQNLMNSDYSNEKEVRKIYAIMGD